MMQQLKDIFTAWIIGSQPKSVPQNVQDDINNIDFDNIYEACDLAEQIKCSFVATIGSQRWRVYPDGTAKVIHRRSK